MNISKLEGILKTVHETEDALLIEGVHGIGKSQIVENWTKDNNFYFEPLFLSHQDIGDIIGNPHTITVNGEAITSWAKPVWLQRMEKATFPDDSRLEDLEISNVKFKNFLQESDVESFSSTIITNLYNKFYHSSLTVNEFLSTDTGVINLKGKPCTLLLDELNRAPKEQRDLGLQLVLNRQAHNHKLPIYKGIKTLIVAAINPSDKYQVSELDPALLDRFLCTVVEPDVEGWLEYAKKINVNEIVRSFILNNPSKLHFMPEEGAIDQTSATPRSWVVLGKHVDNFDNIPEELHYQIIKGKVGGSIGSQFYLYYQNFEKVITIKDIESVTKSVYPKLGFKQTVKALEELLNETESISKMELLNTLEQKYLQFDTTEEIIPYLSFLYSLELEVLASYLKTFKEDTSKRTLYRKLVSLDYNKGLFSKIVNLQEEF